MILHEADSDSLIDFPFDANIKHIKLPTLKWQISLILTKQPGV